jgi:hypothetical protein
MDSLNNHQVGGTSSGGPNTRVAYRFRAGQSGSLSSIRIYLVDGSGYAGGTGGTMSISVQTDDGSASHVPSGTVLASKTITPGNPIAIGYLPLITFPSPATLVAGQLYHIVFTNTDPNPTVNFVSTDSVYYFGSATNPHQPLFADVDWGQLVDVGRGSGWQSQPTDTPILALNYANGTTEGMGYMEVWAGLAKSISGAASVREQFTVSGSSRTVNTFSVRVRRVSGTSPLTVRLQTASGTLIEAVDIPASSIPIASRPSWVSVAFATSRTLASGQSYHVVLSASSDTTYSAYAIERGNGYNFAPSTYFADGHGQYTTNGTNWSGFDQPGGSSNNNNSDLQFYFR